MEIPILGFPNYIDELCKNFQLNEKLRQKVCSLAELGKYLEEVWEFATQLQDNKVVARFSER
jgi:hypothetical protein